MKKVICFLVVLGMGYGLFAFDSSLNGSWGLVSGEEKKEFIRFNTNEFILMDTLYRSTDYQEMDDTIYIEVYDDSVVLQFYKLAANKLLFLMWNTDDPTQSMTLILSKL